MKRLHGWGVGLFAWCAWIAPASAAPTPITIVHLNDTHSWLDSYGDSWTVAPGDVGGIARAATALRAIRAADEHVLALHAGDLMHGTEFFNGDFGGPELQLLDQLGFDAMTVGNHELDLGPRVLAMVLDRAAPSFPLLGANLELSGFPALGEWIVPSTIKEVGGVRVGIFGMTTPDDLAYRPAPVRVLGQGDPDALASIAADTANALLSQGADVIVLLSHLGEDYDHYLGTVVPALDVIIGGHTHAPTLAAEVIAHPGGSAIYVRAGANYSALGKLALRYEAGHVSLMSFERVVLDASVTPDADVQTAVEALKQGLNARYGDLYGESVSFAPERILGSVPSDSPRRDSPLGNLLTDAYRARTGTELAFTPSGLFGGPIYRGPVTPAEVFRVTSYGYDPASGYGFKMATFEIIGAEILKGLEVSLAYGGDLFLEVSGLSLRYDSTAPDFAKIERDSVRIHGRKLRPDRLYTATVNEGSAQLLPVIGVQVRNLKALPDLEFDVLRDYVARYPIVWSASWGRIWDVARAPKR